MSTIHEYQEANADQLRSLQIRSINQLECYVQVKQTDNWLGVVSDTLSRKYLRARNLASRQPSKRARSGDWYSQSRRRFCRKTGRSELNNGAIDSQAVCRGFDSHHPLQIFQGQHHRGAGKGNRKGNLGTKPTVRRGSPRRTRPKAFCGSRSPRRDRVGLAGDRRQSQHWCRHDNSCRAARSLFLLRPVRQFQPIGPLQSGRRP